MQAGIMKQINDVVYINGFLAAGGDCAGKKPTGKGRYLVQMILIITLS
jgi:hypothetical protein